MTRENQARDKHAGGHSCSQAVYCTYADLLGMDTAKARSESSPWAGGAKVKCGAVYSALQILDQLYSGEEKERAVEKFERMYVQENGSLDCRKLLASKSKNRKTCRDYVGSAAGILDEVLDGESLPG